MSEERERDQFGRIIFDVSANEKIVEDRKKAEKEERKKKQEKIDQSKLKNLNVNLENIRLSRGINKRKVIGENVPTEQIGQWSCPVCKLFFKDSNVYLKHLTSPAHNEKLGMSLKVEPVTDEDVIKRVNQWDDFYIKGIPVPPLYKSSEENVSVEPKEAEVKSEESQKHQEEAKNDKIVAQSKDDESNENKEYDYEYEYVEEEEEEEEEK